MASPYETARMLKEKYRSPPPSECTNPMASDEQDERRLKAERAFARGRQYTARQLRQQRAKGG